MNLPLAGVKVLDFSTLLPGPLCTLILAEAGADVVKVERPGRGDEMRTYEPKLGADSINFLLLNRGKKSFEFDLKDVDAVEKLTPLIVEADVLVEQFRPGVMERLGLGYEALSKLNPRLIYCSITGYGQKGGRAQQAAHDLNYAASTGLLSLTSDRDGAPVLPPALIADIAGGSYPALINILLALRQRDQTGHGTFIDISMADNLFAFQYWGLADGAGGRWPSPRSGVVTGGTPRYQIYRTSDDQYLAAAPLEDKFWSNFVRILQLDEGYLSRLPSEQVHQMVSHAICQQTAAFWERRFEGQDVCTVRVVSLEEAVQDPHFVDRGLFRRRVRTSNGDEITALPVPVAEHFRTDATSSGSPALGSTVNPYAIWSKAKD